MRCFFGDMGCAYVRLVGGSLIVEFTKHSDHEVTIQDLEREGDVLVRMPRQRLSIGSASIDPMLRVGESSG